MIAIRLAGAAALALVLSAPCEAMDLRVETLIPAKRGVVTFGLPYRSLGPRQAVAPSVIRNVRQSAAPPINPELNQPAPAAPKGGAAAPAGVSPGLSPGEATTPSPPTVPNVTLTPPTPATPALPSPGAPAPAAPTGGP